TMYARLSGLPTPLGLPHFVSEDAPAAVRRVGLVEALEQILEVTDLGDLAVERPEAGDGVGRLLNRVVTAARRQACAFAQAYAADSPPVPPGRGHTRPPG